MLGVDDHEVITDEPVNPDDLFGTGDPQDLPPLSPLNDNDDGTAAQPASADANKEPERKKRRQINRLPNLNADWLTNPKMEGVHKVNSYFEKIQFKSGKGTEKSNLTHLLKKYEYWAQQCYPKFCFSDFVDKVENLSGKKKIKNCLQEIRRKINTNDSDNEDNDNDAGHNRTSSNDQMFGEDLPPTTVEPVNIQQSKGNMNNEPSSQSHNKSSSSPDVLNDEMKEMIRRKREEAIAKRKRKLEESLNASKVTEDETLKTTEIPDQIQIDINMSPETITAISSKSSITNNVNMNNDIDKPQLDEAESSSSPAKAALKKQFDEPDEVNLVIDEDNDPDGDN